MTLAADIAGRVYTEDEYDVFAVMDTVPQVVKDLDPHGSRFVSIVSAFFGIGSAYIA